MHAIKRFKSHARRPTVDGSEPSIWPDCPMSASRRTARRTSSASDPLTQGRNVLDRRCLGCHVFEGNGSGTQTASDLIASARRPGFTDCCQSELTELTWAKSPSLTVWPNGRSLQSSTLNKSTTWPISSRCSAAIPDDLTVDDWLNSPGVSDHPGSRHSSERMRPVPHDRWASEGEAARAPESVWLGISLVDLPG